MRLSYFLSLPIIAVYVCGTTLAAEPQRPNMDAEQAFASGQARALANDLPGAQADLEKAVLGSPSNTKYQLALGLVYLRTSQGQLAVKTYSGACPLIEAEHGSRSPRLQACHTLWAHALMASSEKAAALEKFRSAYDITFSQNPRSVVDCLISLHVLSHALNAVGRGKDAIELYERLLSETPTANHYRPEVEEALRRIRNGQMPPRVM